MKGKAPVREAQEAFVFFLSFPAAEIAIFNIVGIFERLQSCGGSRCEHSLEEDILIFTGGIDRLWTRLPEGNQWS